MNKKISCLLLCSFLLFSCTNNNVNNKEDVIYNENEEKLDCVNGAFGKENGIYNSKKINSLYLLKEQLLNGTFSLNIKCGSMLQENGVVFNYKNENNYYFIGFNLTSSIIVNEVIEGVKTNIYTSKTTFNTNDYINLSFVKVDNRIEIYANEIFLYEFFVNTNLNNSFNKVGLLAGSKNTLYKNITISENINEFLTNSDYFKVVNGSYDNNNTEVISSSKNSIIVSNSRTLTNGTIEVNVSLSGDLTDNGIIFSLENNNKDTYFESGVSYYFYFVNLNGLAFLGKVNNGTWSPISYKNIVNFDPLGNYKLKVIKDNEKIYCFLDDNIVFMANDDTIHGNKVALRAGGTNVGFSSLKIEEINSSSNENYNVYSGNITSSSSHFSSTESNTIATIKGLSFTSNTLEAKLIPGTTNNNGIIFKASKINDELSYYWLYFTSTGQVGFSKVVNGVEKREMFKFLPYGRSSLLAYNIKIVIKDNDIYCYFDNRLSFLYHDENMLEGNEVGIKSIGLNCALFNVKTEDNPKIENYEYLIFGHSYTEYWYTYKEDFKEFEDIYDIGMGASNTFHWTNQYINEVMAYKAHYGIYWNGINDISANFKATDIANNVEKLLTTIKDANPNFEVALIGVNRCPFASNKRNEISAVNNLYKELGNTYDFIHFVDVEYLYCDSNKNELNKYFTDGLHPNHEGYKMAAQLIKEALNK